MTHHPKCEWIRARRELCNCTNIAAASLDDPFTRLAQLEREVEDWKRRHGKLFAILSMKIGLGAAFEAAMAIKNAEADEDIQDLL